MQKAVPGKKSLHGKHIFIDPNVNQLMKEKIKDGLTQLGAIIEEFLDRNVQFVITDNLEYSRKTNASSQHLKSISRPASPFNHKPASYSRRVQASSVQSSLQRVYSTRWRNVAKYAHGLSAGSTNDIMETARNLGIKIEMADEVWAWLNKQKPSKPSLGCRTSSLTSSGSPSPTYQEIFLRQPCIKVDDGITKPVYEEFDRFPQLDLNRKGNKSPFVFEDKDQDRKECVGATGRKKNSRNGRRGYCECCECSYLSESKHMKSLEHLKYCETATNFQNLNDFINHNQLDIKSFLARRDSKSESWSPNACAPQLAAAASPRPTESEPAKENHRPAHAATPSTSGKPASSNSTAGSPPTTTTADDGDSIANWWSPQQQPTAQNWRKRRRRSSSSSPGVSPSKLGLVLMTPPDDCDSASPFQLPSSAYKRKLRRREKRVSCPTDSKRLTDSSPREPRPISLPFFCPSDGSDSSFHGF